MVTLSPSAKFGKLGQRGGKAYQQEAGLLIADFATLFIDRTQSAAEEAHVVARVLAGFDPAALREFELGLSPEFRRSIRRDVRTAPQRLVGQVIEPISRYLCRMLPGCTADTISQEVANRKATTVQGAHAWMLRPFLLAGTGLTTRRAPLAAGALYLLELDGKFSCAEHGNADEMLRFYPDSKQYPGAVRAIERGCGRSQK